MDVIRRKATITKDEQRAHPEGGSFRFIQGQVPGKGTFEIKEHKGLFHAKANNDNKTTDLNMDEGGLVAWFYRHFGK